MITLIDAEKVFDTIQHLFMIKNKNRELGIKGNSSSIGDKEHLWKTHKADIILYGERLKIFPMIKNKKRMPTFTIAIHDCTWSSSQKIGQEKK